MGFVKQVKLWLHKKRTEIVFKILKRQVHRCQSDFVMQEVLSQLGYSPTSLLPHPSRICYFLNHQKFSRSQNLLLFLRFLWLSQSIFQNVATSLSFAIYVQHNQAEMLHFSTRCPQSTSCHYRKWLHKYPRAEIQ